jgi:hypothetical protein
MIDRTLVLLLWGSFETIDRIWFTPVGGLVRPSTPREVPQFIGFALVRTGTSTKFICHSSVPYIGEASIPG